MYVLYHISFHIFYNMIILDFYLFSSDRTHNLNKIFSSFTKKEILNWVMLLQLYLYYSLFWWSPLPFRFQSISFLKQVWFTVHSVNGTPNCNTTRQAHTFFFGYIFNSYELVFFIYSFISFPIRGWRLIYSMSDAFEWLVCDYLHEWIRMQRLVSMVQ